VSPFGDTYAPPNGVEAPQGLYLLRDKNTSTHTVVVLNIAQRVESPAKSMLRSSERSLSLEQVCRRTQHFCRRSAYLKYAYFARALLSGMIKDMMRNTLLGGLLTTIIGMYVLMSTTTPSGAHPALILFFFLLFYVSVLIVLIFLLVGGSRIIGRFSSKSKIVAAMTYERAYMVATLLALAPVMIVAMNSVGGVSLREVLLIVAFEAIALFYVWKRR